MNLAEHWGGTITTPDLWWRPDFQDADYWTLEQGRIWSLQLFYPWLMSYPDVGLQYEDFVARINVEGATSAGVEHYGWARLFSAADRASVGNRDVTLDTWIDTATECQTQARRLLAYQGEPNHLRIKEMTLNTEHLYQVATDDGITGPAAHVFNWAGGMPGDHVVVRSPFGNSHLEARDWPAHAPDGGDLYDTLEALWTPSITYNATSATPDRFVVRSYTRTFTPNGGWDVTVGVDPSTDAIRGSDVSEFGNGTY
jgi:hypothetical protein